MELQKTLITRRMDDLGRVNIPKEVRRAMGITQEEDSTGVPFEISYTAEGVFLRRITEEECEAIRVKATELGTTLVKVGE